MWSLVLKKIDSTHVKFGSWELYLLHVSFWDKSVVPDSCI